jgi:hypothetical protein
MFSSFNPLDCHATSFSPNSTAAAVIIIIIIRRRRRNIRIITINTIIFHDMQAITL